MPECSDKGPNKDSNGKKKIKENCNTSNLIMHIIKINVDMSTADEEQRETILGFGILFVFLFSGVLYILPLYQGLPPFILPFVWNTLLIRRKRKQKKSGIKVSKTQTLAQNTPFAILETHFIMSQKIKVLRSRNI